MPPPVGWSDVIHGAKYGESNRLHGNPESLLYDTFLLSRDSREFFLFDSSLVILGVSQKIGDMHREKRICVLINGRIKIILCFIYTPVLAVSPERMII